MLVTDSLQSSSVEMGGLEICPTVIYHSKYRDTTQPRYFATCRLRIGQSAVVYTSVTSVYHERDGITYLFHDRRTGATWAYV